MKRFGLLLFLAFASALPVLAQTQFSQSYGPVASTVACTAATGVATGGAAGVCGGQGAMFEGANIIAHTISWTVTGTGSVSSCTVQLESSAAGATFVAMTGAIAQTCTSSGTYTYYGTAANYVKFNVTALTTTGNDAVQFNYYGTAQGSAGPTLPIQVSMAVPTSNCPIGSLDINLGATTASTSLYVCGTANTWTAVTVP
jgi:hypothetical protein